MTKFEICDEYKKVRGIWISCLEEDTKSLILDFTILWNMFEHQVFNDNFTKDKAIVCCGKFCNLDYSKEKILYLRKKLDEYNLKFESIAEIFNIYGFLNSNFKFGKIKDLYESDYSKDSLLFMIYTCYRVRCNLFHGPKCIMDLDNQKKLFICINELISIILKEYGI